LASDNQHLIATPLQGWYKESVNIARNMMWGIKQHQWQYWRVGFYIEQKQLSAVALHENNFCHTRLLAMPPLPYWKLLGYKLQLMIN